MTILSFDTLATVRKLQAAGFSEDQAEAVTLVVRDSWDLGLADLASKADAQALRTELKADIDDVRRDLRQVETRLEAKIETAAAGVKVDVLRWLLVTQVALGGFIFATLKFLH